jgi:hypothetical protein
MEFMGEVFELPCLCSGGHLGSITLARTRAKTKPIDKRAWTFQERLLSPRTLQYGTRQLRWICQESERGKDYTDGWTRDAEDIEGRIDMLDDELFQSNSEMSPPDVRDEDYELMLEDWYDLVGAYSNRKLTIPTDRILAISGIVKVYSRKFGDEYLAGLWKSTFCWAILWTASNVGKSIARPQEYQGPS